ncbi:hypothetical protein C8J57DRAFT_1245404 [Mycena rebaudengoi]|nr:hypothetical protein C8J57DRAFT_1245404 [Mycena rebaudengoi]
MSFLLSGLKQKAKTRGSTQAKSAVNKFNVVNKVAKLAGGVGEMIPVGGPMLKGISTTTSIIVETIEARYQNSEDLQEIGRRVRATELLITELKDLTSQANQQTVLGSRYIEACRKFEQLLARMYTKIVADLNSNTRGFISYLRTKEIKNLIDGFKVELDDIRIHWLMKTMAIVHATVSPDDGEDLRKFSYVGSTMTKQLDDPYGLSYSSLCCLTSDTTQGGANTAAVTQAFEHDLAGLERIKSLRFPQIFGICRTSSLKAIVFNEGADAFMTKEQYQRRSNLAGIDWVLHQLKVHLQHSDAAVDMVQRHRIVIEVCLLGDGKYESGITLLQPYRGLEAVVRFDGQLVVTGFRGLHGSSRSSWLHDPLIRALRESFESRALVPIQWFALAHECVPFIQGPESLEGLPATTPLCACLSFTEERLLGLACFKRDNPPAQLWLPGFDFQGSHVMQKGIPNVFEWTLDPNANSHTLTLYVDWTTLRLPFKKSSSVLYCAYAPHFNVKWREPRGISITISRKHTLAPERLSLYVEPPALDLENGTLIWQPLQLIRSDGTCVDWEERDFTAQYQAIYSYRHWDPRGLRALIDLHCRYEVDPAARGRDIARKIGPEVEIRGFFATEVTWVDFLHSNCTAPEGVRVGDEVFFQGLQDFGDFAVQPNPLHPQIEELTHWGLGSGVCWHQIPIIGSNPIWSLPNREATKTGCFPIEKQPDLVDQMHIRNFGNFRA